MNLSEYTELIHTLPCVLCWKKLGVKTYAVEAHHPTVPRNDWLMVPLCYEHHRGSTGVHGDGHRRGFERRWKVTQDHLLGWTNEARARFADR